MRQYLRQQVRQPGPRPAIAQSLAHQGLAALSANHLAAMLFPATLRRLYVARDRDLAGDLAVATLTERARSAGIEALTLSPALGDFNDDLRRLGFDELRAALRSQLARQDVPRFLVSTDAALSRR